METQVSAFSKSLGVKQPQHTAGYRAMLCVQRECLKEAHVCSNTSFQRCAVPLSTNVCPRRLFDQEAS